MYTIEVDTHTHTIASIHAFSTIEENARQAAQAGIKAIAMTDHFGPLFNGDAPALSASMNMASLPPVIYNVRVLAGVEIDIVDGQGHLAYENSHFTILSGATACQQMLSTRDFAIASIHDFGMMQGNTNSQNTEMYCNVLRTPGIDMLGHIDRTGLLFDLREVVAAARSVGKLIEINEHSFDMGARNWETCRAIALECAEQGVHIAVSSDAHSSFFIGKFDRALAMLEEIDFPQELIANCTLQRLTEVTANNRIHAK